jgi:hypothetical protein
MLLVVAAAAVVVVAVLVDFRFSTNKTAVTVAAALSTNTAANSTIKLNKAIVGWR